MRIASSLASEPEAVKRNASTWPGAISPSRSARARIGWWAKTPPEWASCSSWPRAAATTRGWAWPRLRVAMPEVRSRSLRPSAVSIQAPSPRTTSTSPSRGWAGPTVPVPWVRRASAWAAGGVAGSCWSGCDVRAVMTVSCVVSADGLGGVAGGSGACDGGAGLGALEHHGLVARRARDARDGDEPARDDELEVSGDDLVPQRVAGLRAGDARDRLLVDGSAEDVAAGDGERLAGRQGDVRSLGRAGDERREAASRLAPHEDRHGVGAPAAHDDDRARADAPPQAGGLRRSARSDRAALHDHRRAGTGPADDSRVGDVERAALGEDGHRQRSRGRVRGRRRAPSGKNADDGECEEEGGDDEPGDRPATLRPAEVLDARPAAGLPRPLGALGAEHEGHDDPDDGDQGEERDPDAVPDPPDPGQQEGAPVPALDRGRQLGAGRRRRGDLGDRRDRRLGLG